MSDTDDGEESTMVFLNGPEVGQQRSLLLFTFYRLRIMDRQIRTWLTQPQPVPPNTRRGSTTSHDVREVSSQEIDLTLQSTEVDDDDFADEADSGMTYDHIPSLASFDLLDSLPTAGYTIIRDDRNSADDHEEYDADSEDDDSVSRSSRHILWHI
jgi:hypothetical protein